VRGSFEAEFLLENPWSPHQDGGSYDKMANYAGGIFFGTIFTFLAIL